MQPFVPLSCAQYVALCVSAAAHISVATPTFSITSPSVGPMLPSQSAFVVHTGGVQARFGCTSARASPSSAAARQAIVFCTDVLTPPGQGPTGTAPPLCSRCQTPRWDPTSFLRRRRRGCERSGPALVSAGGEGFWQCLYQLEPRTYAVVAAAAASHRSGSLQSFTPTSIDTVVAVVRTIDIAPCPW